MRSVLTLAVFLFLLTATLHAQTNAVRLWGVSAPFSPSTGFVGKGFIFSSNSEGNDFAIHKVFENNPDGGMPYAKMVKGTDGIYYGTTRTGGEQNTGVIYRINANGSGYTKVHEFDPNNEYTPTELIEGADGRLYGATINNGSIFSVNKDGTGYVVIHKFGASPGEGVNVMFGVIQGSDGFLYGTTMFGGTNGSGTIYRLRPDGTDFETIFNLSASNSLLAHVMEGHDGMLYWGGGYPTATLSRISKTGTQYAQLKDNLGEYVRDFIQLADHTIVGITSASLAYTGTLFEIQPDGSDYAELQSLTFGPVSLTLAANGKLYGGGNNGQAGLIFRIDTDGSNLTMIRENGPQLDGVMPQNVVETTPGNFLGVAPFAATSYKGAIFSITDAGTYVKLKDFPEPDGITPITKLTLASNGYLYGTTESGGDYGSGTIFAIKRDGAGFVKIRDLESSGDSENYPRPGLVERNGYLYGARRNGVFRITLNGNDFAVLDNTSPDDTYPFGNLIAGQDGVVYGLKASLTRPDAGIVFQINGTQYTDILDLSLTKSTTGSMPTSITQLDDGRLVVVTARNGSSSFGTVFSMDTNGDNIIVLKDNEASILPETTGNPILEASDGLLYGTAASGSPVYSMKKDGTEVNNLAGPAAVTFGQLVEVPNKRIFGLTNGLLKIDMQNHTVQKLALPVSINAHGGLTVAPKIQPGLILYDIPEKKYGDEDFVAIASFNVPSPVIFTSSNPSVAKVIDDFIIQIVGAGTTTITARQAETSYVDEDSESKVLTVTKASPAVAITSLNKGYKGEVIELQAFRGGSVGAASYTVTNGTGSATVDGNKLTLTSPGIVTVKLTVAETANFNVVQAEQSFIIALPLPDATFASQLGGKAGSTTAITLNTGGSTGAVTLEVENISGTAEVNGNTIHYNSPGTVRVTATIAADANHSAKTIVQIAIIDNADGTPFRDLPRIAGTAYGGKYNAGVLFQMNADYTGYAVLNNFERDSDGANPESTQLVEIGDKLYGTIYGGAHSGGILFQYSPATETYVIEHEFTEPTGVSPNGILMQASDGKLYGLTTGGGSLVAGVIFSYDPSTKVYAKKAELYPLTTGWLPSAGFVEGSAGKLYCMAQAGALGGGTILEYDINTSALTIKANLPAGVDNTGYLTKAPNGKLYGINRQGGNHGQGTLFEFDPVTAILTTKVHFDPNATGALPVGGLTLAPNGNLYGVTSTGPDVYSRGTIVEYVPGATSVSIAYRLTSTQGYDFFRTMLSAPDGKLYGLTTFGGLSNSGTIFQFDPLTHDYAIKVEFQPATGSQPLGALVSASNGKIYGMAGSGGAHDGGVLFEFDPTSDSYTVKKNFIASANGFLPGGFLPPGKLVARDSKIYGYATGGGLEGGGVLYAYDEQKGVVVKKLDFGNNLGFTPVTLIDHPNGKLYTVTSSARHGLIANGKILEYDPDTGVTTPLATFNPSNRLITGMILAGNQKFYGTTSGGPNGWGEIFEFDPAQSSITIVHTFTQNTTGENPGYLMEGAPGILYGTASNAGPGNGGILFRYDANKKVFSMLHAFDISDGAGYYPGWKIAISGDEKIYGTTYGGGQFDTGVLYEYDDKAHTFTIKNHFKRNTTNAGLIFGSGNKLIGAFQRWSATILGTIFEFDIATGVLEEKFNFTGEQGTYPGEMIVLKGKQSIVFNPIPDRSVSSPAFNLEATATSGLTVSYVSSNPNVATITGNTVTIVGGGETTIAASQAGDNMYYAAEPVSIQLKITKVSQTVTFGALSSRTLGDAAFALTATSTSSLPVTFSSTSDKITIASGQVAMVKAGRVSIKAEQAGNANYTSATPVEQGFCINPSKPVVTLGGTGEAPVLTSSNETGNQWYLDGTAMNGSISQTLTATKAGQYTVKTTVDDCSSVSSEAKTLVVTGLNEVGAEVSVYPNPAAEEINVKVSGVDRQPVNILLIDALGRVIEQRNTYTNITERFDTRALPNAWFFLRINTEGQSVARTFVKH